MLFKNGKLTFGGLDWYRGMAASPYLGNSQMIDAEVFDTPGVLRMANRTALYAGVAPTNLPIKKLRDISGSEYRITRNAVYKGTTVIQSGLSNVWDACIFRGDATDDYLLVRHGTVVSAYGPLASLNAQWFGNVATGLSANYYGKMHVAINDNLPYIANGSNIKRIDTMTGGTPFVAPVLSLSTAFVLPQDNYATTLAEVSAFLMVGTQGGGSWFDRVNFKIANILPFRIGDDATTYEKPISLNECGIQQMISDNNVLYVVAGTRGNVYKTDTSSYVKIKRLPWVQNRIFNQYVNFWPNAIAFNNNGNLLIGTTSAGNTDSVQHGVFEMNVSDTTSYPTVLKHTISTKSLGRENPLAIGYIYSGADDSLEIGWQDSATYGIDATDFICYTDFQTIAVSELARIGEADEKATLDRASYRLAKPLVQGQRIRISFRKNLVDDFTELGTFDTTNTNEGDIMHPFDAPMGDMECVEVMVELTQETDTSVDDFIELMEVAFWQAGEEE